MAISPPPASSDPLDAGVSSPLDTFGFPEPDAREFLPCRWLARGVHRALA